MDRTTSFKGRLGGMPAPEQIICNGVGSMGRRLSAGLLLNLTVMAVKTSRTRAAGVAIAETTGAGTNAWSSARTAIFKATVLRTTTLETLVANAAIVETPLFRTALVRTTFVKSTITLTAVTLTAITTASGSGCIPWSPAESSGPGGSASTKVSIAGSTPR